MASSIFGNRGGNSVLDAVAQLRAMGDPQSAYDSMYRTDPQFRQFADSMKGKTPEQAFGERGLDFDAVRRMIGR